MVPNQVSIRYVRCALLLPADLTAGHRCCRQASVGDLEQLLALSEEAFELAGRLSWAAHPISIKLRAFTAPPTCQQNLLQQIRLTASRSGAGFGPAAALRQLGRLLWSGPDPRARQALAARLEVTFACTGVLVAVAPRRPRQLGSGRRDGRGGRRAGGRGASRWAGGREGGRRAAFVRIAGLWRGRGTCGRNGGRPGYPDVWRRRRRRCAVVCVCLSGRG